MYPLRLGVLPTTLSNLIEASNLGALNEVLEQNETVMVEFGATWCGPCRQFLPHFEDFSDKRTDVTCVKVDIETDDFSLKYGIQSVPQVWLFKNGEKVADISGRTVVQLKKEIDSHLS